MRQAGMVREAVIRGYHDGVDAIVLSLFLDPARSVGSCTEEDRRFMKALAGRPARRSRIELEAGWTLCIAGREDAADLAALYSRTFESYPFPVSSPAYVLETIQRDVVYGLVRDEAGMLVAAASAETVPDLHNAEMTDFATLPSHRGRGLAKLLLAFLEDEVSRRGITNLYTLARASSRGMNTVFHVLGYEHSGTLVKNCHIGGKLEDMHCWCKSIGVTCRIG